MSTDLIQPCTIRIALDWTPNTVHTGLYLAASQSYYSSAGLDVQLLPPDPTYALTPAKRLEKGDVDLTICPSESCIAYAESGKSRFRLQAIYAILQRDASAIVTHKPDFTQLKVLADGVYGSYNARYEDAIVRSMVSAAGGEGSKMRIESSKGKLSLFEELKANAVDATWVFLPWEGVEAELDKVKLNVFRAGDFGIPYGYSPVIARNAVECSVPDEALAKFVQATRQGYELAIQNSLQSAQVLLPHCVPPKSLDFLQKSQEEINRFYSDGSSALGTMEEKKWVTWVKWLEDKSLIQAKGSVKETDIFTNKFH